MVGFESIRSNAGSRDAALPGRLSRHLGGIDHDGRRSCRISTRGRAARTSMPSISTGPTVQEGAGRHSPVLRLHHGNYQTSCKTRQAYCPRSCSSHHDVAADLLRLWSGWAHQFEVHGSAGPAGRISTTASQADVDAEARQETFETSTE